MSDILLDLLPAMVGAAVVPLYPIMVLLLMIGILLLVTAFKKWRKEEDSDDPEPKWMTGLSSLTGLRAVGAGAIFVTVALKQWVFTLSPISIITEANLDGSAEVSLYLFYVLTTQILVLPPILFYAIAPHRTAKPMLTAQGWLDRSNRVIVMTVRSFLGCGSPTRGSLV